MKKHIKSAIYLLKHKWYVMLACFAHGLILRGLLHDLSKLRPSEWFPYAEFFYGDQSHKKVGAFDYAWLLHQKRNDHHWQYWILQEDSGNRKVLEMSPGARLEMVCDWLGAKKVWGNKTWEDVFEWYQGNKEIIKFGPKTKEWVYYFLIKKCASEDFMWDFYDE